MLQEKPGDLTAVKRKQILDRLINELSHAGHDLYYAPTTDVAKTLLDYANGPAGLTTDERALLDGLNRRDVQILLGMNS
ncbi:MAG: hypothetical protein AAFQ79_07460 [Pseudomonadota bacterium]